MSRNYELLTQLQTEMGSSSPLGTAVKAARTMENVSIPRVDVGGSKEIAGMVQRVFLPANETAPRTVVFCGVDENSASSAVCVQVGRALAGVAAGTVCLVDANLQAPCLSELLRKSDTRNGSEYREIDTALWAVTSSVLLGDDGTVLPSLQLKERLSELRCRFDYVLIDAAGINVRADAAVIGRSADAAILVVEAHQTRRIAARKAKENLESADVRLLGTVLHNRTFPIPEKFYRKL